ncbi:L-glutamyl-[BtrI acyl-carrier protein] decarboxylase [Sinobacterium norvegicum]|uniref:L-glutamyl-[BtrI acyl-carrier protein] decarboxylase n=1 Tax=Sinobacterium norvegicum TaxID=1641715 RepID=A0ABM9AI51_9GAMM|nr:pyridoxal-dependent decarboxylase, exosortase A system-associated [Sinobacterium norvegicum]CAH0992693.1 L-glutamyl-[BtrI acyl-carrier protein] decarboxylase [Sinobacterium norvegicum]
MKAKKHSRLERLNTTNNQLIIAGYRADQIIAIAGSSPCYIYARDEIVERVTTLRQQLPPAIKLHYAIKANPMPAVVQCLAGLVDGLDVASHGELTLALATSVRPDNISFAGPGKKSAELMAAVVSGVVINVESPLELARINDIASGLNQRAKVALRVNPDFELKTAGMKMGGGPKQFGIDAEQIPAIFADWPGAVDFVGLHIFSGSQNLKPEALIEAHDKTFELAARLSAAAPTPPLHINIGGGLGIPYFPGEPTLETTQIMANLQRLLDELPPAIADSECVMELGRYLVGEAGYYLCTVTDIKQSRGQTYVVTDGGLHHHLSNSGNFGQVLRKNYPVVACGCVESSAATEPVELVGPLCTPLDIVGAKMTLGPLEVGDHVAVLQSGAYGASASPQGFLGHPSVVELLL